MVRLRKTIFSASEADLPEIVRFETQPKIISSEEVDDLPPVDRSYLEDKWKIMHADEMEAEEVQIWQMPSFEVPKTVVPEEAANDVEGEESEEPEEGASPEEVEIDEVPEPALSYPTANEIEEIHQEAYKEGYEEGFAVGQREGIDAGMQQGQNQAREAGRVEFETDIAHFIKIRQNFIEQLNEIQREIPRALLNLALDCAQKILGYQIHSNDKAIIHALEEAIASLSGKISDAKLRLNPADISAVEYYTKSNSFVEDWVLVPDATIERGGGKIDSTILSVDFTIRSRWNKILESLGVEGLSLPETPKVKKIVKKVAKNPNTSNKQVQTS